MSISLIKEEEKHTLQIIPILLKQDSQFKNSLYEVLGETFIKKDDFAELKGIVKELANAQIEVKKELKELSEAQKKTEIAQIEIRKELKELAEAQKKTEIAIKELSEAQKRTDAKVKSLQKEVGGISNLIGYELEEKFYPVFPMIIKKDFNAELETPLERKYILYPAGGEDEINIYAEGRLNGEKAYLIGESKAQLGKGDIDDFGKVIKRVKNYLKGEILPVFLCYIVHPKVEKYLQETYPEIKIYKSYEIKRLITNEFNITSLFA